MTNHTLKHLMLLVLAAAFLALPVVAKADAFTFKAPAISANGKGHQVTYDNNALVQGDNDLSNNMFLASQSFRTEANTLTSYQQRAQLAAYIANGSGFAFGFDGISHFWNKGISFRFSTVPTSTPEPGTMLLLGSGVAGLAYFKRRRHARKRH